MRLFQYRVASDQGKQRSQRIVRELNLYHGNQGRILGKFKEFSKNFVENQGILYVKVSENSAILIRDMKETSGNFMSKKSTGYPAVTTIRLHYENTYLLPIRIMGKWHETWQRHLLLQQWRYLRWILDG